jgi:serine/threonine protein kinase
MAYLHHKMIVFRDLKPANVGFDSRGVLKLFDFGFARCTAAPDSSSMCIYTLYDGEESRLLYDKCGIPRYMAPEVGLEMGHSFPADVHSFGILLWQICAHKKPFDKVESVDQFHKLSS